MTLIESVQTIPLDHLKTGQRAIIVHVGGNGQVRRRYLEMGFVRGEEIQVGRVAPLGDPTEYLVKGYHLSLRKEDAGRILVQRCEEKECPCPQKPECENRGLLRRLGWRRA